MKTLKLLVVDDEPGIRLGIKRALENYNLSYPFLDEDLVFKVLEAEDGEKALEIMDKKYPDIVLLDNRLPGIQGIEVLEVIKQKQYDCKVAMITSYPSLDIAVKATEDGASDFIPKPFTPAELKSSIATITKQLFLKRITAKMKKEGKQVRYQFLSVLSHELKSPLNAILGYLDMMKGQQLGQKVEDYNEMIERCIARANGMKGLIMDLLDFTKVKLEKSDKNIQDVNLIEIAKYAIDSNRPQAIQKDLEFVFEANDSAIFRANPEDMEIVFNNLISNAVKYNKDGGKVTCSIEKTDKEVKISVEDTGIGMTEDEVSKLFGEFVRIKNEKTKYISGSGLGLSILKKITELYNGNIFVESKEDVGSKFIVVFPREN
jgi:two-component system, sensor histidine kinase and response regulator